jgi:peptide/nickel transport system permease protein
MIDATTPDRGIGRMWTRRRRQRRPLVVAFCALIVGLVVAMTAFGSFVAPHDPSAVDMAHSLLRPSSAHWLGTDQLGRDVLSRVVVGARTAFLGPLVIAAASMLLGNVLGLLAGYLGGVVDAAIMRWVDLMWSVPALLVIIVVVGALGSGYWIAVALLTVLTIPFDTRVVRGATLEQTPRPYVEAAKTLGVADRRIMAWHIWPNISSTAVANSFLVFAGSLVTLSSLSFVGLGASPGTPDWGGMLSEGRAFIFANPVATLAPGAAIVATAASMNVIGDWLYEKLSSRGATR